MSGPYSSGDFLPPAQGAIDRLYYTDVYNVIFRNPRWIANVFYVTLCTLIPLVGYIVIAGYMYEMIESLHRRETDTYPDFNFDKFGKYLQRGVWPFLVTMAVTVAMMPLFMIGFLVILPLMAVAQDDLQGPMMLIIMLVNWALSFGMMGVMSIVLFPLNLRAGLAQGFAVAFDWQFIFDFARRMWVSILLMTAFLMVSGVVVMMFGLLAFCIGIYPAVSITLLARAHAEYQMYEVYLSRGGQPIPLQLPQPAA